MGATLQLKRKSGLRLRDRQTVLGGCILDNRDSGHGSKGSCRYDRMRPILKFRIWADRRAQDLIEYALIGWVRGGCGWRPDAAGFRSLFIDPTKRRASTAMPDQT
jgi:predicted NodU family carbamoyl transferase